jgi:hypothetical protein
MMSLAVHRICEKATEDAAGYPIACDERSPAVPEFMQARWGKHTTANYRNDALFAFNLSSGIAFAVQNLMLPFCKSLLLRLRTACRAPEALHLAAVLVLHCIAPYHARGLWLAPVHKIC